jgi:hypothetical protein
MITSPSRNEVATGLVRPHNANVPVKAVKIPTAPTAVNQGSMKALQTEEICDGRLWSVVATAVGKAQHCRPYGIPANHYIHSHAGGI